MDKLELAAQASKSATKTHRETPRETPLQAAMNNLSNAKRDKQNYINIPVLFFSVVSALLIGTLITKLYSKFNNKDISKVRTINCTKEELPLLEKVLSANGVQYKVEA